MMPQQIQMILLLLSEEFFLATGLLLALVVVFIVLSGQNNIYSKKESTHIQNYNTNNSNTTIKNSNTQKGEVLEHRNNISTQDVSEYDRDRVKKESIRKIKKFLDNSDLGSTFEELSFLENCKIIEPNNITQLALLRQSYIGLGTGNPLPIIQQVRTYLTTI